MNYRIKLLDLVERRDVLGSLALLKDLGVSSHYITKRSEVNPLNFYKWRRGEIKNYREEDKEKILETIRYIYL